MSMILPTPSIIPFAPFDPVYEHTIEFLYTGNQPKRNRVVITNNTTNEIVYDIVQQTGTCSHTIPANTINLNNWEAIGNKYEIQVQVFDGLDAQSNSSNLSIPVLFYCFTTPTFHFANITDNQTYRSATLPLEITYLQTEGETLRSGQFFKYSYDKALLSQSPVSYTDTSYTFNRLDDNTTYYFRAIGETANGITVDTGYVGVNIAYDLLPANLVLQAENKYCEGYIQLVSCMKDIDYVTESEHYSLDGEVLKLYDNSLTYQNIDVEGDFVLFIEAYKLPVQKFFTTSNGAFSLSVINVCGVYYCRLHIQGSNLVITAPLTKAQYDSYVDTENGEVKIIHFADTDTILFEVGRMGNDYSLKTYYRSELSTSEAIASETSTSEMNN